MRQATPPDPALAAPARPRTTPYQGLQPYAEGDAPFFFGRDAERAILAANPRPSPHHGVVPAEAEVAFETSV